MRTLRFIHRWLGIALALPLLVQGLTGAILTLEPAIPSLASHPAQPGPAAPANTLLAAAIAAAPATLRPARYLPSPSPGEPAQVIFVPQGQPRGPGMVVSLDPATAAPLGPAVPTAGIMDWIKRLHTTLLVPEWGGRQLAGWLGVGLLLLTLLGLPLWWPNATQRAAGRWKDAFTVPRDARGTRLHRRLHGAMGIWLTLMMLATSTTGIVQGFPQTSRAMLGIPGGPQRGPESRPARPGGERAGRPAADSTPQLDLDAAIRLATQAVLGSQLRVAMLPASGIEPVRLILGTPGTEGVTTATTVLVDAAGPAIRSIQSPAMASLAETTLRWAHDLHFGQGFGPVWRGLTVLVGVALPIFGVTGVSMWWLKRRNRRRLETMKGVALHGASQAGE